MLNVYLNWNKQKYNLSLTCQERFQEEIQPEADKRNI